MYRNPGVIPQLHHKSPDLDTEIHHVYDNPDAQSGDTQWLLLNNNQVQLRILPIWLILKTNHVFKWQPK